VRLFDEPSASITDSYLARAYELAENGRGCTHPNPVVGCVIVKDGSIVGEGYHAQAGGPHAEVLALSAAGSVARGATAYVTLEPCNHHGKTAPCTDALRAAGIARVIMGCADPNPRVTGGGAEALRASGIEILFSDEPEPFEMQNTDWRAWVSRGTPWVTLKTALTLDGRATRDLDVRTQITGSEARETTMRLRRRATAVAVGARTALVDKPRLDLSPASTDEQPQRIVLSGGAVTSPGALAEAVEGSFERPWLILTPDATLGASAPLPDGIELRAYEGGLRGALEQLGSDGFVHLLVEAGPGLFTSFWDEGLIDELILYHAGGVLGADAPSTYGNAAPLTANTVDRCFGVVEAGRAGLDAVTVWRPTEASVGV
jgi:diaminohydroxyphosphoribosylaminopyrimidine deaminase/5-amino-6-(5-phosphoribosylamino)uracil reductase